MSNYTKTTKLNEPNKPGKSQGLWTKVFTSIAAGLPDRNYMVGSLNLETILWACSSNVPFVFSLVLSRAEQRIFFEYKIIAYDQLG